MPLLSVPFRFTSACFCPQRCKYRSLRTIWLLGPASLSKHSARTRRRGFPCKRPEGKSLTPKKAHSTVITPTHDKIPRWWRTHSTHQTSTAALRAAAGAATEHCCYCYRWTLLKPRPPFVRSVSPKPSKQATSILMSKNYAESRIVGAKTTIRKRKRPPPVQPISQSCVMHSTRPPLPSTRLLRHE